MIPRLRLFCALLPLALGGCARHDPLPGFPRLVLWAWEHPEDLRFIDPNSTGVAFLARTITLHGRQVISRPRLQPLRVPPDTSLMAVVRIESHGPDLPKPDMVALDAVRAANLPKVKALQIDFDAKRSERVWYAALLGSLRRRLNPTVLLSMTALSSWCDGDRWIGDVPVNDAVPMLFRMGRGEAPPRRDFRLAICRSSIGVATDELPVSAPRGRRLFVFHRRSWTEADYRDALQLARRWQ